MAPERFGDVVIGTSVQGVNLGRLVCLTGQNDDWRRVARANLVDDVESVTARHGEVKEDQSRLRCVKPLDRFNAVVRRVHRVVTSG